MPNRKDGDVTSGLRAQVSTLSLHGLATEHASKFHIALCKLFDITHKQNAFSWTISNIGAFILKGYDIGQGSP